MLCLKKNSRLALALAYLSESLFIMFVLVEYTDSINKIYYKFDRYKLLFTQIL